MVRSAHTIYPYSLAAILLALLQGLCISSWPIYPLLQNALVWLTVYSMLDYTTTNAYHLLLIGRSHGYEDT